MGQLIQGTTKATATSDSGNGSAVGDVARPAATMPPAPAMQPRPDAPPIGTPYTLTVIVPAKNEAASIVDVVREVRTQLPDAEVIVVNDGSTDDTAVLAEEAGARVVHHPYSKGNGASVKTGLRAATGEVVLIIDADGQHDPADLGRVLAPVGAYDLVVGARSRQSNATAARGWGNLALNRFGSYLTGMPIPDLTSGFRAMKRDAIMEFIHLLPNQYSSPTTGTLAFIKAGYSVKFVPIEARHREGGSSGQKLVQNGIKFGLIILRMVTLFSPMKVFLPFSIILFILGAAYGVFTIITEVHVTNSTVLLVMTSIIIFLMGLISEQIAALRFERRE